VGLGVSRDNRNKWGQEPRSRSELDWKIFTKEKNSHSLTQDKYSAHIAEEVVLITLKMLRYTFIYSHFLKDSFTNFFDIHKLFKAF
jgi:hypothetical protein